MNDSSETPLLFAAFYFTDQPVNIDDATEIAKDILLAIVEKALITKDDINAFAQKILQNLLYCKERGNNLAAGNVYLVNIDSFEHIMPGIPEKWLKLLEGETLFDLNVDVKKFIDNVPVHSHFLMCLLDFIWHFRFKKFQTSSRRIQRLKLHEAPGILLNGDQDPDAHNVPWDLDSDYELNSEDDDGDEDLGEDESEEDEDVNNDDD